MKLLQFGYSLIELMIVIAIVGIISAIAYPSYQSYTCDTYRGQAVADLKVCGLALERYYSNGFTYVGAAINGTASSLCSNRSPTDGGLKFNVTLITATANDFEIRAVPVGNSCDVNSTITLTADVTLGEL